MQGLVKHGVLELDPLQTAVKAAVVAAEQVRSRGRLTSIFSNDSFSLLSDAVFITGIDDDLA